MLPFDEGSVALPDAGQITIIRAQADSYDEFPCDRLTCVQGFFPTHKALQTAGFTAATDLPDTSAMTILHVARSKDESRALLARAFDRLDMGGILLVDGTKTDGIESLMKAVKLAHGIDGQLSKAHGKVFWLTKNGTANPFSSWADALVPAPNTDGFMTAAGLFSADGIDPGSAELAPFIAGKLKGKVADLGAGWGWLSAQALDSNPGIETLDLIEAEHSALACARLNVTDPRAAFKWADATDPSAKRIYDAIITNPPFHTGRKAEPALGRAFIAAARGMLKATGQMFLVANRQLAYEATLDECFSRVEVLSQTSRYKIIHARKPK